MTRGAVNHYIAEEGKKQGPSVVANLQDGPPRLLAFAIHILVRSPLLNRLAFITNRILWKHQRVTSKARQGNTASSSLGSLIWKEASCHVMKTLKQPHKRGPLEARKWLLPTAM